MAKIGSNKTWNKSAAQVSVARMKQKTNALNERRSKAKPETAGKLRKSER